ncbi:MAG: beta-glucosidase, partial [Lachnospiraceae bacterium]|nr:beta-glucosidase [Lachnospiraceae bacterium]
RFHVELWLAPSMNLHRNPLCGRNFEYYSEDPFITGACAAAVTDGLQSFRRAGVTLKHFACNNQEDNRHGTDVHISERAIREIYLKGFELCVKKARPEAVMSAYNLINGIHCANHYDLLTTVLREEWGFDGIVMTDWGTTSQAGNAGRKYKASTCAGCIQAGNDLIMPGAKEDFDNLYRSVCDGEVSMVQIRRSAGRLLRMMLKLSLT